MLSNFSLKVLAAAAALMLAGSANAIVIDNFNSGAGFADGSNSPVNLVSVDAIGGSRTLEYLSGAAGTSIAVAGGLLGHSSPFIGSSSTRVTWDANGAGLGGRDITDGGSSTGVELDIVSIDVGDISVTISISDTIGGTQILTLPGLMLGSQSFLFTDFVGMADLSTVESISMTIEALETVDVALDLINTINVSGSNPVPAPGTLLMIGTGLLLFGRRLPPG